MRTYEETMRWGAGQYADVLDLLCSRSLPAEFTQTGGMCAAIEVRLDSGAVLLITNAEDALSWYRDEHEGWGVGLYANPDASEGLLLFDSTPDGALPALLALVERLLGAARGLLAAR